MKNIFPYIFLSGFATLIVDENLSQVSKNIEVTHGYK